MQLQAKCHTHFSQHQWDAIHSSLIMQTISPLHVMQLSKASTSAANKMPHTQLPNMQIMSPFHVMSQSETTHTAQTLHGKLGWPGRVCIASVHRSCLHSFLHAVNQFVGPVRNPFLENLGFLGDSSSGPAGEEISCTKAKCFEGSSGGDWHFSLVP